MEELSNLHEDQQAQSRAAFSDHGPLARSIDGFLPRLAQLQLAEAVTSAIQHTQTLVVEAGTGTGKTFAYLVPCLLSRKKTLISTATKTLQDQLFYKDIPTLMNALSVPVRVQNLKGRANYLCQHRIHLHAEEGKFLHPQCAQDVMYIREQLPRCTRGERTELPEIAEDSPAWPYVTSTSDNCLGHTCEYHATCFLMHARKRAMDADVVIINHHMYFSDTRLKDEGLGELLPHFAVTIFDEAHQLAEIATHFHGNRLGTQQLRDWMQDTLREWPVLDLVNQPLKPLSVQLEQLCDQSVPLLMAYPEKTELARVIKNNAFFAWLTALDHLLNELMQCFAYDHLTQHKGVMQCKERLMLLHGLLRAIMQPSKTYIRWIERFSRNVVLHETPQDIADIFRSQLEKQAATFVFTSATLTMASSFDCFTKPLGLEHAATLLLSSPFDFKKQALLYLPRDLPDPKQAEYYHALLKKVLPIINALQGRCFFLFTSHRGLQEVAQHLATQLAYPVLVQGTEAKTILLDRFRSLGNAVLLGTATFWEGVDVKGDALSCVIIDKLPFASPADPVICGRMAHLASQQLSGFDTMLLPQAVLALKQGIGRLIRDVDDKGILIIADPRLTARPYGQRIFASLPSMHKTRDEKNVLAFIETLALPHETISN